MERVSANGYTCVCGVDLYVNVNYCLFHADGNFLGTVNTSTGALTNVAALIFSPPGDTDPRLNALDFQPGTGTLFASHDNSNPSFPENYLSTVDTTTSMTPPVTTAGQVNIIGLTQSGLDAIAFVPATAAPANPDVQITITDSPDPVVAGATLTYTVTVTNNGPGNATGVFVTDQLPSALRNVTATPSQGTCSPGTFVMCSLGTIGLANSVTITITATVVVSTIGGTIISNTASVASAGTDPTPGNNSASTTTTISAAPTADHSVAAITHATAGASKLWAGTVTIEPNVKTGAHHHGALESVIYVVSGKARMRWGEELEFFAEAGPGDFIYVPPYVPHQEINANPEQPLSCVLVRSGQEPVVVNLNIPAAEEPVEVSGTDTFHKKPRGDS